MNKQMNEWVNKWMTKNIAEEEYALPSQMIPTEVIGKQLCLPYILMVWLAEGHSDTHELLPRCLLSRVGLQNPPDY